MTHDENYAKGRETPSSRAPSLYCCCCSDSDANSDWTLDRFITV